jgi:tripartite-type tricarboxylate transporter receptor subunit TctC
MKRQVRFLLIGCFVFAGLIFPEGLLAAPYYQGKRITIVVGFSPGSGYDRMTRMIIRYLPKYIPGKPTFIVENMPGGSSMIAANQVFNIAKPDGLTLGSINRGLPVAQMMKTEGINFDLSKVAWIGSMATESIVFCVRGDLPYKTVDDLKKSNKEFFMSSGGPMTSGAQFCMLLKEFLKLNVQDITYTNTADSLLAVERKEVDGTSGTYSTLRPLIERGVLRPLLRGRNAEAGIENLPIDEELTADKTGKKIMAMRSATEQVGRPYVAAPGTPPEVMKILRDAFANVAKDPQLQADARKSMMPVEYLSAEECLKVINYLLNQPGDVVKEFNKYIKF